MESLEQKAETRENLKIPNFDADLSPYNPQNIAAAEARNLTYNPEQEAYIDEDGYLIRDRFGQPF